MGLKSVLIFASALSLSLFGCKQVMQGPKAVWQEPASWKGQWIGAEGQNDSINSWTVFRTEVELAKVSDQPLFARIAVDSKYWLWINGKLVIREGGLKRGPTPEDTYYDVVDLGKSLRTGQNSIAILLWYYGKDGFSHKSSGEAGLLFDLQYEGGVIKSDSTWVAWPHKGFGETGPPFPNYRLPESNILFDARQEGFGFTKEKYDPPAHSKAKVYGFAPRAPWNQLVSRPIPQWKDFGLKEYGQAPSFPFTSKGDTLKLGLPYNAQITPYFKIKSVTGGDTIDIRTDHYFGGGPPNVRAQYVTRKGVQEFECFGWMNGEEVFYHIPDGVEVLDLRFRESGYDTEFRGTFSCDDPFYDRLWQKSLRTLYVTMRDTYMDCPDRERAQWWGDVVLESGESFYALDRRADALTRKGILELLNWQRADSTIFSPVPAGNWDQELPGQMLASVGYYGVYNYYLQTGDLETIEQVYKPIKEYLALWKLKEDGTVVLRKGGWTWGDWGENKDVPLLLNTQYHLAQKGLLKMAEALGKKDDVKTIKKAMDTFKKNFNSVFWKVDQYRSAEYSGLPDDRSQALAVISGLAEQDKFPAIYKILHEQRHASPYMEKYVCEALFQMGQPAFALQRLKERFGNMANYPETSTLWEGWGIGREGYGGGTTNHAWSGGGLTLLSQYAAGISPLAAGYTSFQVRPQMGKLKMITCEVPSILGQIKLAIDRTKDFSMNLTVPDGSEAHVIFPEGFKKIRITRDENSKTLKIKETPLILSAGTYKITAR